MSLTKSLQTLLLGSILLLSACWATKPANPQIDTLVLHYQSAEQRRNFQAWLKQEGWRVQMLQAGAGQAEYQLLDPPTLSPKQEADLREHWQKEYHLEKDAQRLILVVQEP